MKFNTLKEEDLLYLLVFTLDYFKQDVNYKIENNIMKGKKIETIDYISKEESDFILEGIKINDFEILPIAYSKIYLENNSLNYDNFKFRELLTYISIWGLQGIYEAEYLNVPKYTSQKEQSWGISDIN